MEIMVYCYADNNALIGAGIDTAESTELKEYSWLYEGFSESYYEFYNILKLPPAHEVAVQQHDAFSLRFSEMLYLHFYTPPALVKRV